MAVRYSIYYMKMTVELNFENLTKRAVESFSRTGTNSHLAVSFTMSFTISNNYKADFCKILPGEQSSRSAVRRRDSPLIKFLKKSDWESLCIVKRVVSCLLRHLTAEERLVSHIRFFPKKASVPLKCTVHHKRGSGREMFQFFFFLMFHLLPPTAYRKPFRLVTPRPVYTCIYMYIHVCIYVFI